MNSQEAHDALLTWSSEVGSGDIAQFRISCGHLSLSTPSAARALSQLGHVEFDWDHHRFAAAPSTLTAIPGLPGRLLLTGARPSGLIAELHDLSLDSDLDIDISRDPCHQFGRGPSTVFIDADPADAPAFCEAADLMWSPSASSRIGQLLPAITVTTATVAHRPDERFPHTNIDPHTFEPRWDQNFDDGGAGLWLYRTWGRRREMILRTGADEEPRLVLDADVGPYLMERPADADPIVEYRRAHRLLVVNAAAPLPTLHARAACLCSGRLPVRRDVALGVAYDHYVNVDTQTAHRIVSSLGVPR